ncbi:MAG: toprim domain-containing protein [Chloroflexi bacterium]|nr:toprim domain-containing protein [Chloroflexota bacterium]
MRPAHQPDRDPAVLKRRFPLEQVVAAAGVRLRRSGVRLVGRCPFHDDRTPSFTVYPEQGTYHCFGCGAHGDVIAFVMTRERCGFAEAVARLAGGGVSPAPRPLAPPAGPELTPRQRAILTEAAAAYAAALVAARALDADLAVAPTLGEADRAALRRRHRVRGADAGLAYLRGRGVRDDALAPAGVGWCDGDWLAPLARCHGWVEAELVELGLLDRRGRERLAGRVTLPEWRHGHCVWLTGRLIDPESGDRPKYLGVRAPRRALGLEAVAGRARVVIVEGAIDYLVGLGWGLPVLALGGLGLSPGELAALRRTREIVLLLDADAAGRAEAARLAALIGPRARVVGPPPPAKDLADLALLPAGRERLFATLATVVASPLRRTEDHDATDDR